MCKHDFELSKYTNVIYYDEMSYPLRLCIIACKHCKKTEQVWIDTLKIEGDVEVKWTKA